MVLKKKEIIAASLVVLIGVAGYLNWSYQDTIRVQDPMRKKFGFDGLE